MVEKKILDSKNVTKIDVLSSITRPEKNKASLANFNNYLLFEFSGQFVVVVAAVTSVVDFHCYY